MAKERVALMQYLNDAGEELGANAKKGATAIRFDFVNKTGEDDKGKAVYETVQSETVKFSDLPKDIIVVSAAHGVKQKLADSYAGSKGRNVDPHEDFMATLEQIQGGEWVVAATGGAGPRPSMVFEAMLFVLEKRGRDVTDEALREKVKASIASTEGRKSALANPEVAARFAEVQAEKAAEKAAKAAAVAKAAAGSDEGDSLDDF